MEEKKKKFLKAFDIALVLVLLFFASLIFAIVYPAALKTKVAVPKIKCKTNLRQLHLSIFLYQEKSSTWPQKEQWCDLINPYIDDEKENIF